MDDFKQFPGYIVWNDSAEYLDLPICHVTDCEFYNEDHTFNCKQYINPTNCSRSIKQLAVKSLVGHLE